MIYYCRDCERIIPAHEVQTIDAKDNPHNSHRNKIVGIEDATFRDELKQLVWRLEKTRRLLRVDTK